MAATTVPLALLRAQQRLRDYIVVSSCLAGATAVLTVTLVVVLDRGVTGWLLAMIGANFATLVAAVVVVPWGAVDRLTGPGSAPP